MIDVTVLPLISSPTKNPSPVEKLMNERLVGLASDLRVYLGKVFSGERTYEDVVVYLSYNAKYGVQWKIVNDVSIRIFAEVSKCCTNLGYLQWKDPEL